MYFSATYTYSFIAWITVLTPSYTDAIIASLVKKGYVVGATAAKGDVVLSKDNNTSAIISLKINSSSETVSSASIHKDVMQILSELKAYYYSIVVTPYVDCCWCGTNIIINKPEPIPEIKPNKSNLN